MTIWTCDGRNTGESWSTNVVAGGGHVLQNPQTGLVAAVAGASKAPTSVIAWVNQTAGGAHPEQQMAVLHDDDL